MEQSHILLVGSGTRGRRLALKNLSIYEASGSMGTPGYGSEGLRDTGRWSLHRDHVTPLVMRLKSDHVG